jgi:hypothetical protein
VVESEYIVFVQRNSYRAVYCSLASVAVMIVAVAMVYPALEGSTWVIAGVALVGIVACAIFFIFSWRMQGSHESGASVMSREKLRKHARRQELLTAVLIVIISFGAVIPRLVYSNCPYIVGDHTKAALCSYGFTTTTWVMLPFAVPHAMCPIRWFLAVAADSLALFVLIGLPLLLGTPLVPSRASHDIKSAIIAEFCVFTLVVHWLLERSTRREFEKFCQVVHTKRHVEKMYVEARRAAAVLLPFHVSTRIIKGERVVDEVADGCILMLGIPNYLLWCSRSTCTAIVESLNGIFCAVDEVVDKYERLTKMQTLGDLYVAVCLPRTVVGGAQDAPDELLVLACATELVECPEAVQPGVEWSILLDKGNFACVVLGSTSTYVAIGPGIRSSEISLRSFNRAGITMSPPFANAVAAARDLHEASRGADAAPALTVSVEARDSGVRSDQLKHAVFKFPNGALISRFLPTRRFADAALECRYREYVHDPYQRRAIDFGFFLGEFFLALAMLQLMLFDGNDAIGMVGAEGSGRRCIEVFACAAVYVLIGVAAQWFCLPVELRFIITPSTIAMFFVGMSMAPEGSGVSSSGTLIAFLLIYSSFFRTTLWNDVVHYLVDAIFILLPVTIIQLATWLDAVDREDLSYATVFGILMCFVMPFILDGSLRTLQDLALRDYFLTRERMTVVLQRGLLEQAQLEQVVGNVIPPTIRAALHAIVTRRYSLTLSIVPSGPPSATSAPTANEAETASGRKRWFATKIADVPILALQLADQQRGRSLESVASDLELCHARIDAVLERGRTVYKAKSTGTVVLFASVIPELTDGGCPMEPGDPLQVYFSAMRLVEFAECVQRELLDQRLSTSMVLTAGPTVGGIIGTDRLSFELFGEPVATALELLRIMTIPETIATTRFVELYHVALELRGRRETLHVPPDVNPLSGAQPRRRTSRMVLRRAPPEEAMVELMLPSSDDDGDDEGGPDAALRAGARVQYLSSEYGAEEDQQVEIGHSTSRPLRSSLTVTVHHVTRIQATLKPQPQR